MITEYVQRATCRRLHVLHFMCSKIHFNQCTQFDLNYAKKKTRVKFLRLRIILSLTIMSC